MVSVKERDKILQRLTDAEADGGRATPLGDAPEGGAFLAPVIVREVAHGSLLTRTEVFGPVAPIVTFVDADDDAVRMTNDTEYGQISYVYAPDFGSGLAVGRRMESGMVAINRGVASDAATPFGG